MLKIRILNVFLTMLIIVLLIINILQLTGHLVVFAVVKGTSMLPLFRNGDLVIIIPTKSVSIGSVIVYRGSYNQLVIHRVVAIARCSDGRILIATKGDNNPVTDVVSYRIAGLVAETCIVRSMNSVQIAPWLPRYIVNEVLRCDGYVCIFRGIPLDRVVGVVLGIPGVEFKVMSIGLLSLR